MFEIIFGYYLFLFPVLLIASQAMPFALRVIAIELRATIQVSLIVYSFFLIRQLIGLYQITRLLKMNHSERDFFGTSMVEMLLIIVLPFLFLYKKIRNGYVLGLLLWLILLHAQMQKELLFLGGGILMVNAILFYISLLTAIYALIWFINQSATSSST
jgi:hypothetical protein